MPSLHLFVPQVLLEFQGSNCSYSPEGSSYSLPEPEDVPCSPHLPSCILDPKSLDSAEEKSAYMKSVNEILTLIDSGSMERLTLARRFTTKQKLDLLWTFGSDTCRHPVSRSFYYSDDNFSFAGQSPELLAEGTRASFQ